MKKIFLVVLLCSSVILSQTWDWDAEKRVAIENGWQYGLAIIQGFKPCDLSLTYSSKKDSTFLFSVAGVPDNFNGSYAGTGGWFKNQENLAAPAFIKIKARVVKKSASTWKVRITPQLQSKKYGVGYLAEKILPLDGSWVTHTWDVRRMGNIDTMLVSGIIRTYWLFQGCTGTDSSSFQLIVEVMEYTFIYPDGSEKIVDFDFTKTEIKEPIFSIPTKFELFQNYPNPFNPSTTIEFAVPVNGNYALKVYDVLGQEIASLIDKDLNAGTHKVSFDASKLSSGTYVYRLVGNNVNITKKMMLTK